MSELGTKADLLVFEFGGSARSGKGTIVEHLSKTRPGVAKDETGLYYRKLTYDFLSSEVINTKMTSQEVIKLLSDLPVEKFEQMLADRQGWGEGEQKKKLYSEEVNRMVADIGQLSNARKAVKSGFAERIRNLIRGGQHRAVVIDGRNLSEVVKTIDGAQMMLRTFVDCSPYEAALRECSRNGTALTSTAGQQILKNIELRNDKDRNRQEDPMVVDNDAVDFWQGSDLEAAAKQLRNCSSAAEYLNLIRNEGLRFSTDQIPNGISGAAMTGGRQIFFDTTPFRLFDDPVAAMLAAADSMFDEVFVINS